MSTASCQCIERLKTKTHHCVQVLETFDQCLIVLCCFKAQHSVQGYIANQQHYTISKISTEHKLFRVPEMYDQSTNYLDSEMYAKLFRVPKMYNQSTNYLETLTCTTSLQII